eukprot:scaffold10158_cov187-Skeletonema_marinoi.AAC.3
MISSVAFSNHQAQSVLIQTYFVDVTSSLTFIPVNSPSDVNDKEAVKQPVEDIRGRHPLQDKMADKFIIYIHIMQRISAPPSGLLWLNRSWSSPTCSQEELCDY